MTLRFYLEDLEKLHQPRVYTSAMMMDDKKDLLCCMTCEPPASLGHARYGENGGGWPCETRELIDGLKEYLKRLRFELGGNG